MPRKKRCTNLSLGLTFVHVSQPGDLKQSATLKTMKHHVMSKVGRSRRRQTRMVSFAIHSPRLGRCPAQQERSPDLKEWTARHFWDRVHWSLHPYCILPVNSGREERLLFCFSMRRTPGTSAAVTDGRPSDNSGDQGSRLLSLVPHGLVLARPA